MTPSALVPARSTLENGIVVLAKRTRTTPAVTINVALHAGSICDPAAAPGAMYLLSKLIDRGTAMRSTDDIAEALDSRGISLGVTVTRHLFSFICTCLADDFDDVMSLLGEIIRTPSLPDAQLTTRKGEVITMLRQDEDNPGVRATEALMEMLYPPPHPYGRRTKGTIEIIDGLTRDRLADLHATRFAPAQTCIVTVGDVDPERSYAVIERVFGGWKTPAPPPVALSHVVPVASRRRVEIPMMNKAQADIAYGFTTLTRDDPDYYACWLMNHAFGQYSMSGRLGDSIRERQGMAYYAYSSLDANIMEGPLLIRAGVSAANIDRALQSIDEEVTKLVTGGLSQKELDDSRRFLIYAMPRALETNAGIANYLQTTEFFKLGLDYDARMPDLLRGVTLDHANAVARRFLSVDRASVVIAGPYSTPSA
ncbi:MAG TPA: pitrilysin family protein [Vicinamibacterales bacterium]|nr:pitrilysin family protein [Vicinamibacterales bacterium]